MYTHTVSYFHSYFCSCLYSCTYIHIYRDLEPSTPQDYIIKGVVHASLGQQKGMREQIKMAQQCFQLVGTSAHECDTIPGRQVYTYTHTNIYTHTYIYTHAYIYSYTLIYAHTYIHTYIHLFIYLYVNSAWLLAFF